MTDEIHMTISLPLDESGMVGRECPNPDCQRYFKVKPGTGIVDPDYAEMFCPYCESKYSVEEFNTEDQQEYFRSSLVKFSSDLVEDAIKGIFNRPHLPRSSKSFVSVEWHYKPGTPPRIHEYVEQELQTTLTCENCTLEYAIWGVFAVCPDCGKHNLYQITETNLNKIEHQINLKDNLETKFGDTEQEYLKSVFSDHAQSWIEAAYKDLVTAFETFCKDLDSRLFPRAAKPSMKKAGNIFQRLNDTRRWFQDQYNIDLFSILLPDEIELLRLVFSKRHILTHNMGIIDAKYIQENNLNNDVLGHKVEVDKNEIQQAVSTVKRVVQHARTLV